MRRVLLVVVALVVACGPDRLESVPDDASAPGPCAAWNQAECPAGTVCRCVTYEQSCVTWICVDGGR